MNMIAGNFPFQRMVIHLQIFMIWKTLFFKIIDLFCLLEEH